MLKWRLATGICLTSFVWAACFTVNKETALEQVLRAYRKDIVQFVKEADAFIQASLTTKDSKALQDAFNKARRAYKRVEWLAEYYQPYTARFINGPALEEVEPEDPSIVIQPEGFQVIEPLIFPRYDSSSRTALVQQAKLLRSNAGRLQATAAILQTTDAHIFDALRLQLFRIASLGLSGFDSPVAQNSITEAGYSLKAIADYVSFYQWTGKDRSVAAKLEQAFSGAQSFLLARNDFIAFDRMQFLTAYINPLSENLLLLQKELGFPVFKEPRALKADARNLFAEDVFNPDFYAPRADAYATEAKRSLGARLFYEPALSARGSRSCASCHHPDKAFTDGLKTNLALNSQTALRRNTPSLLNSALQPALFYDTRVAYLEDQAKAVITNKDEMHGSMQVAVAYLKSDKEYKALFDKAYKGEEISEQQIKNAIAAYIRSLIALNSRFDQYMRGKKTALSKTEIDGFNLFMGKAKCGTCHFAPLFNGSNPPYFTKIDAEVIGVPSSSDKTRIKLDSDEGKFYLNNIMLYRFAFKTPTVRNSALTAPYMHNGIYKTLEEVIEFYDGGGGRGLGLALDNQTLPADPLHLTGYEKKAVVAFLQSLTDTAILAKAVR